MKRKSGKNFGPRPKKFKKANDFTPISDINWSDYPVSSSRSRRTSSSSSGSYLAKFGAAAGGYIAGGVTAGVAAAPFGPVVAEPAALYGAVAGGIAAWNSVGGVSQTKSMKQVINSKANKSGMKVTGKAKVKTKKVVKVSPYLRSAIKQVNAGVQAQGLYKRTFAGLIGSATKSVLASTDFAPTQTIMGTSQIASVAASLAKSVGAKTWFSALCQQNTSSDYQVYADHDLNFFTPAKIWHAASVLFNKKAESNNPYSTTTGNLTATTGANGGLDPANPTNLKIDVKKSYVKFTMRNMSTRNVFVDIYECVSVMKFNPFNPLVDAVEVSELIQDNTTTENMVQVYENNAELNGPGNLFLTDGNTDAIAICKSNGWKWKYVKKSMLMAPGENCVHTVAGPSGLLNFQTCWDPVSSSYRVNNALKDWSKHVMISVRPEFAFLNGPTSHRGLRWNPTIAASTLMASLIAVEVTEAMHITVPEIAGFIFPVTQTEGTAQPLTLRKKRYQFTNLVDAPGVNTAVVVIANNEETPSSTQTSNLFT